jgi:hypothetical protein
LGNRLPGRFFWQDRHKSCLKFKECCFGDLFGIAKRQPVEPIPKKIMLLKAVVSRSPKDWQLENNMT